MGTDFLTYYILHVEYTYGNKIRTEQIMLEESRKHHYCPEWSIDDIETESDNIATRERNYIQSKLQRYVPSVIFQEGAWLCSQSYVHKCMKILQENDIPWDKVTFIKQYGDYHTS